MPLRRIALATAALLGAGLPLLSWLLFVRVPSATPAPADAVVMFAGGRGERLQAALALMDRGVAPVLVISNGLDPFWWRANRVCAAGHPGVEVLCPRPEPSTTQGEALMLRRLAAERGWRRVVLVTSTYHARRAALEARRCYDGELQVIAAEPRRPTRQYLRSIPREWAALAVALAGGGACQGSRVAG